MLKLINVLIGILSLPVILLVLFSLLLYTPIDFIRYRRSLYYRDTKEKYRWLSGMSSNVKLYNTIRKENLPVQFIRDDSRPANCYGYFVFENNLILCEDTPVFNAAEKRWEFEEEDVYIEFDAAAVQSEIDRCNELLNENVCTFAYVLLDHDDIPPEAPLVFETYRLVPVREKNYAAALREILDAQ